MLTIDGAYGEGGGQILRSAVTLSAITGKSIEVINIRAKRHNPGLRPQHMHATRAVAEIFHARVENLKVGAEWIRFVPKPDNYEGGELRIDTGTAGSIPMHITNNYSRCGVIRQKPKCSGNWRYRCEDEPYCRLSALYHAQRV